MADSAFDVLSLCSGIGMLDEGIRIALPAARVVGYVERDAFAQATLLARMEGASLEPAPVWCGSLEDFPRREWRGAVDCLTAGFPCQPWSAAGLQRGHEDERWLWPAIADIVRDIEPSVIFLENVAGLVSGRGLNSVLADLACLGFDAEWIDITAANVGAAHERRRIFILAVDSCRGFGVLRESFGDAARLARRRDALMGDAGHESRELFERSQRVRESARADGVLADTSDGFVPIEGRGSRGRDGVGSAGEILADANGRQREQLRGSEQVTTGRLCGPDGRGESFPDSENDGARRRLELAEGSEGAGRVAIGGSERLEGIGEAGAASRAIGPRGGDIGVFAPGPGSGEWRSIMESHPFLAPAIESGFRSVAYGDAVVLDESRADQLRAIGNGVVALQAAVAFSVLARRVGAV